ncbi:MAG: rubrerythrin family protein [Saccharofermentanaceae bacterium]|jgi:rubrerythrin|nr:rubrerythrin family protein [Clostridia bacterium]NLX69063.1 rubrerythrin family protein [Clostridiaceae bacterium]HOO48563.1 rubrerythrin family protein [Saccharofermentans sp.]HPE27479.1 rubrerythrin family protein [Saccharofermentans sp.]HPG64167.1 rubrerythrin family protein [Saccharofermentans sp.]
MELKGSKTEANLQTAFAGESMATNKYSYFSSKARKEGYVQISDIFAETSGNEREHAKLWFKFLNDGDVPDTKTNLLEAANGEYSEWTDMYKRFAEEAKEEGFTQIATLFSLVAGVEKEHEKRYRQILEHLEQGVTFERDGVTLWKCLNCGYIHHGSSAPTVCPVCAHAQAYFVEFADNY